MNLIDVVAHKLNFGLIKQINVDSLETWEGKIFLTFDMDWACDAVLADTISLIEEANVPATWFVTHNTPLLERLKSNSKFELGIHPNFNFLLNGDSKSGATAEEVIDRLLEIVPNAKSVRSHSMTQSSGLLELFVHKGLTHDCNHFIPEQAKISLKPWLLWNSLTKVPYFWEDDVTCLYDNVPIISKLVQQSGIKVFDFHPIHVFLNTEKLDRYEHTRNLHQKPNKLINNRHEGEGTRTYLLEILKFAIEKPLVL